MNWPRAAVLQLTCANPSGLPYRKNRSVPAQKCKRRWLPISRWRIQLCAENRGIPVWKISLFRTIFSINQSILIFKWDHIAMDEDKLPARIYFARFDGKTCVFLLSKNFLFFNNFLLFKNGFHLWKTRNTGLKTWCLKRVLCLCLKIKFPCLKILSS